MRVTFILKDLSEQFYNGFGEIVGLMNMSESDKFEYLSKISAKKELCITMKIGTSNSFRDRVDLNSMLRGPCEYKFKLEPRKGYRLATFEIKATK